MDGEGMRGNKEQSLKSLISNSLRRCHDLGINPDMKLNSRALKQHDLKRRIEKRPILQCLLDSLVDVMRNSNVDLLEDMVLTDEEGFVLFIRDAGKLEYRVDFLLGACLAEEVIGTNGIGLALQHLKPFRVRRDEHYLVELKDYVSLGIPVISNNSLLGCIGIFASANGKTFNPKITESVVGTALCAALEILEAKKSIKDLYLMKELFNRLDSQRGLLIIDGGQNLMEANSEAEQILGAPRSELLGQRFQKFFEIQDLPTEWKDQQTSDLLLTVVNSQHQVEAEVTPVMPDESGPLGWIIDFKPVDDNRRTVVEKPSQFEFSDLIGNNREFVRLIKLARAIARSPSNVMITGESGTGKDLLAQAIHYASQRREEPFVAINCAAIPKELIESELFGYVEGAFTGARKGGMKGKFAQADGGTLLLDEIGDMPLELQPKLLRVLQERVIIPVGGGQPQPINIRVISATNQEIEKMVADKQFRRDLYYRLNVIHLRLPPLRERKDDIPLLVDYFLGIYNYQLKKNVKKLSPETMECFMAHNWPGNIRELENVIEVVINLAKGPIIQVDDLPLEILEVKYSHGGTVSPQRGHEEIIPLEEVEKREIVRALKVFDGNISQTANALRIGRTTLYRKIERYGLNQFVKRQAEGRD